MSRELGLPAIVGAGVKPERLAQVWLFIVAPLIGAAVAAGVFLAIREPGEMITAQEAQQALPEQQAERTS